ncbi:MAG: alpha/beta hydrolase [Methylacidiphilales bacterium]|nr:alpha/beta hydrolase [Candidatus Methylacidiphilales bacterium]
MRGGLILALMMIASLATGTAQTVVPLWNGPAPQSHGTKPDDIPTLTVYLPEKTAKPVPAMIIFPGGGYGMLASIHEGSNEAEWFQQKKGMAAFMLTYRLPINGYRHPVPLMDAQRAVRVVRAHATEWNIDPAKVGVMGFSAGGHLASTLETHFNAGNPHSPDPVDRLNCRPDDVVLVYPVISMKDGITHAGSKEVLLGPNPDPALVANLSNDTQVTPETPPTVLVHAEDDPIVPIENSRLMYAALQKAGVPSVLQEYPHGGHGFGFGCHPDNSPPGWLDHAYDWLKARGFVL